MKIIKIMVIGGNGRVGSDLVKDLLTVPTNKVTVAARKPTTNDIKSNNLSAIAFDLQKLSVKEMTKIFTGYDAIYFTAGSGGKNLLEIEVFGAIKTMQAAKKAGAVRYIMLSSGFSLQPTIWRTDPHYKNLQNYEIAKYVADNYLVNQSDLVWTLVEPGTLLEEKGTGKIAVNIKKPGSNPIPDVAKTLFAVLTDKKTYYKVIIMHSGDTPIEEAINEVK